MRTEIYALYALAISGHGELTTTLQITNTRELDAFSRAALAIASGRCLAMTSARSNGWNALTKEVTLEGESAYWKTNVDDDGSYHQKTLASATRSTALALDALVQLAPISPSCRKRCGG